MVALIYCLLAQFILQVFVSGTLEKVTSRVDVHQDQRMQGVLGNFCSAWRKYLQGSGNECISVPRHTGAILKDRRNNLRYPPQFFILEEMQCKRYGEHIKLFLCFCCINLQTLKICWERSALLCSNLTSGEDRLAVVTFCMPQRSSLWTHRLNSVAVGNLLTVLLLFLNYF